MEKIRNASRKVKGKFLPENVKAILNDAPRFQLFVVGHSFVRRWVHACHSFHEHGSAIPPNTREFYDALSMHLVDEDVIPGKISTSPMLSQLKCDGKISNLYVLNDKNLNLVSHLLSYVNPKTEVSLIDQINSNLDLKMVVVDIFSNSIANLCSTTDNAIDEQLILLLDEFRSFVLAIRQDIIVLALTVSPRDKGLLPKIKPTGYKKKQTYTDHELQIARQRFEQRRILINASLMQMDRDARQGQAPVNFRAHKITCWPKNSSAEWMDSDGIHPTPEQLRLNYSAQIKKAVLHLKNNPTMLQLLSQ